MSRAAGRVARLFGTVTLGRLRYAAHVTVVATLGLLVVLGRSRSFPVLAILFLFGFILSVAIAALTVFRRKGFAQFEELSPLPSAMLRFMALAPFHLMFERAWQRIEAGDVPKYDEVKR